MTSAAAAPMFFGPAHRPLFGWLHAAAPGVARSMGLVLCNPFGYEAVCAYRTLRHLAERASAAGFPTLRFDYDGSGDSAGSEIDPARLDAYLASIDAAVDTLRTASGVAVVCLAGIRLGATLATLAATRRSDVAALVAVAPVANPRAYLRELRALSLARPQPEVPAWAVVNPDVQDIAGFSLSNATRDELSTINLLKAERVPASRVLVLDRNDLPQDAAWSQHLQALGAEVTQRPFEGYVEMMLDAHENIVADDMNSAIVAWLQSLAMPAAAAAAAPVAFPRSALFEDGKVRETALRIGPDARLFGMATSPTKLPPAEARHVVLLLNAGAVSHVGPNRLHVKLARHLAQHGVVSLRMDLSGIGETPAVGAEPENKVYAARMQQDLAIVRDHVAQHYPQADISVVGLCSGAYHGFKGAVSGVRMRRMIAINPLTFFWKEGMNLAIPDFQVVAETAYYRSVALDPSSWLRVLRGETDLRGAIRAMLRRVRLACVNVARSTARVLHIPLQDDLGADLNRAARSPVELVFVFAQSDPGRQLLVSQGGSVVTRLQRRGRLHIEVVAGADHTFTRHWAQARLLDILSRHLAVPPLAH